MVMEDIYIRMEIYLMVNKDNKEKEANDKNVNYTK